MLFLLLLTLLGCIEEAQQQSFDVLISPERAAVGELIFLKVRAFDENGLQSIEFFYVGSFFQSRGCKNKKGCTILFRIVPRTEGVHTLDFNVINSAGEFSLHTIELEVFPYEKTEHPLACHLETREFSCNNFQIGETLFEDANSIFESISFESSGLHITGVLAKPKQQGKFPLLMLAHDSERGIAEFHYDAISKFVESGFVVLAPTFSGQEGPEGKSEGKADVSFIETFQLLDLLECGKQLEFVDSNRTALFGAGIGGNIALRAIQISDEFDSAVVIYPISDAMKQYDRHRRILWSEADYLSDLNIFKEIDLLDEESRKAELAKRSPVLCTDKINTPLLLTHCWNCMVAPIADGFDLAQKLESNSKEFKFVQYENVQTGFIWMQRRDESRKAFNETVEWFNGHFSK